MTSRKDALGNVVTYDLDLAGRVIEETRPTVDGVSSVYLWDYDSAGRVLSVTDGSGCTVTSTSTWDGRGNKLTMTEGLNRTTTYVYDHRNLLKQLLPPIGESRRVRY